MHTRAQLHRRRSLLTQAWDKYIPAICDKRQANAERAGVRTEIVASWERSAAHIMPEIYKAPLADADETRLASAAPSGSSNPSCRRPPTMRNSWWRSPTRPPGSCGPTAAR
jgi:hypothetical protein